MKEEFISLRKFTDRFAEIVLVSDQPILITRGKLPLGFYLPVKIWGSQHESEASRHMVELVLKHSGQRRSEVEGCIDSFLEKKKLMSALRGRFELP